MEDAQIKFEPMTIGDILDSTFRLYLKNLALLIGLVAIAYVPYFVISYFLQSMVAVQVAGGSISAGAIIVSALLMFILMLVLTPLITAAATFAISEYCRGRQVAIGEALSVAMGCFGTLIVAYLVAGLLIVAASFLLVLPGIYVYIMYALIAPVVVIERVSASESRRRSWNLVNDNWWKVFFVLFIFMVLNAVLAYGVQRALISISAELAFNIMVNNAVQGVISIITTPLMIIAVILLYYDLRVRKEGFDLEMLSQALQSSGSAQA